MASVDGWAPRVGPAVEVQIGEPRGLVLHSRAMAAVDADLRVHGVTTLEFGWLPELAPNWRLGGLLALDVDTEPCQGTSPPFCDGAAFLVAGGRLFPTGERLEASLGTELSRALGDRLTLRPRARVRFTHASGLSGAAAAELHLQEFMIRGELGYTFAFGSRDEP